MLNRIREDVRQDYYQQNFSNDGQRFVAWYLRNVHLRDPIQAKDDITDGPDDKQIDAIFVDDEKSTIFVVQGKFLSSDSVDASPLREILSAWIQLKDIAKLQQAANEKLKRKLAEIARALEDEYELNFELLTTGALTESAKGDLAAFQKHLAEMSDHGDFPAAMQVIDGDEIRRRYDMALEKDNPELNHVMDLGKCPHLKVELGGTSAVIAVVPLAECIKFPGIKDGTLFRKNVRQSLGLSNVVNKGIKKTIFSDRYGDFFFFHNGITAICNKMDVKDSSLHLSGLSIVNGCQSLNTILSCSERVKSLEGANVLFRFYEIPQKDRADKISVNTNSQSAVKPRDLRTNDKRVLNLKKAYEQRYPQGYLTTKRGEQTPADKNKLQSVDLSELGKMLIAWHSQRPNISYSETKIFDKYFEQLFRREYRPENINGLNCWMRAVRSTWSQENPLGLNESLLVMRAYAPYHHLYAVSSCFAIFNNQSERVPSPEACFQKAEKEGFVGEIVKIAGISLNIALETAANEPMPANRVFSPQNWIKAKTCLTGVSSAIRNYFSMLPLMPGGTEVKARMDRALALQADHFEYRWAAD